MEPLPETRAGILFFVPHADDLEFGPVLTCIEALRQGHEVTEVLMTNCAYGTLNVPFRGKRLMRIRMNELEKTRDVYMAETGNVLHVKRMGHVDGFLPLSGESISQVRELMKQLQPEIVFAPDPWFSIDYHPDHINTGRIPLLAIHGMPEHHRPRKIYLYYTFKPNTFIPCSKKNLDVAFKALSKHRSQVSPLQIKLLRPLKWILMKVNRIRYGRHVERVRAVKPGKIREAVHPGKHGIKDAMLFSLFLKFMKPLPPERYQPRPSELGLQIDRGAISSWEKRHATGSSRF
ncbi:hypothetical protein GF325_17505 [Candidatus Bathyarchaeota archaeon]|nr:hypothetical protein [Candidatus Bathyarchaeota archaeon]